MRLAKVCPIFKFRTVLKSWDHFALNQVIIFVLKLCLEVANLTWSLTHFCLTEKRTFCCKYICVKVRCWYLIGKWNCLSYLVFSLGVVQNFRSNSRPLNSSLEKNALHIWIQNEISFSKLFEIWKSDDKWQLNNPIIHIHGEFFVLFIAFAVFQQKV